MLNVRSGNSFLNSSPKFSPDNRYVVCSRGHAIDVYSVQTGERVNELHGHFDDVTGIIFAARNALKMYSCGRDNYVIHWDYLDDSYISRYLYLESQQIKLLLSCPFIEKSDKSLLAVISKDGTTGKLCVLKLDTATETVRVEEALLENVPVKPAVVSSGGEVPLVAYVQSNLLTVYCMKSRKAFNNKYVPATAPGKYGKDHETEVLTCVACHPVEATVATGTSTGRIIVWRNANSTHPITSTSHWHSLSLITLTYTPGGSYIYSGGHECVLVKWQTRTMEKEFLPRLGSSIHAIAVSQDNTHTAVVHATNDIKIISSQLKVKQHVAGFTHRGLQDRSKACAQVVDKKHHLKRYKKYCAAMRAFTERWRTVLQQSESNNDQQKRNRPRLSPVQEAEKRAELAKIQDKYRNKYEAVKAGAIATDVSDFPVGIQYDPRSKCLVTNGLQGHLQFYDINRDKQLYNMDICGENYISPENLKIPLVYIDVIHAAFDFSGTWMVTVEYRNDNVNTIEQVMKFWEFNTTKQSYELNTQLQLPHREKITCVRFQPSVSAQEPSTHAVTTSEDNTFKQWRVVQAKDINNKSVTSWAGDTVYSYKDYAVGEADYSSNGSVLAVSFEHVLALFTPEPLTKKTLMPHAMQILGLKFGREGAEQLLYVRCRNVIIIWDFVLGQVLHAIQDKRRIIHMAVDLSSATLSYITQSGKLTEICTDRNMLVKALTTDIEKDKKIKQKVYNHKTTITALNYVPSPQKMQGEKPSCTIFALNEKQELLSTSSATKKSYSRTQQATPQSAFAEMFSKSDVKPSSSADQSHHTHHFHIQDTLLQYFLTTPSNMLPPLHTLKNPVAESIMARKDNLLETAEQNEGAASHSTDSQLDNDTNKDDGKPGSDDDDEDDDDDDTEGDDDMSIDKSSAEDSSDDDSDSSSSDADNADVCDGGGPAVEDNLMPSSDISVYDIADLEYRIHNTSRQQPQKCAAFTFASAINARRDAHNNNSNDT